MSSLINEAAVKRRLFELAKSTRAHSWERVSRKTLDSVARAAEAKIIQIVAAAPSKGKTL